MQFRNITLLSILLLTTNVFAIDKDFECSGAPQNPAIKQAVKWYRDSAEKRAIYRQTFAIAGEYVKAQIDKDHLKPQSWGVILDIDETTLDNSSYFKNCNELADNEDDFSKYIDLKEFSKALPGVVKFSCSVKKQGGYVSLVSNRDGAYTSGNTVAATVDNLKKQGVCFDQIVLTNRKDNPTPSDKNPRFNAVEFGKYESKLMVWSNKIPPHKVIAYIGDNIQDFPKFKQSDIIKLDANDDNYNIFGHGYFILPNPLYGSWEDNQFN